MRRKKGSLLLIFLFTTGIFAIMVTGLYFLITNAVVEQSFVEAQGKRKMIEESMDNIHKSEFDRLLKDYISNGLSPTLTVFESTHYQASLWASESWAFPNTTTVSNIGSSAAASTLAITSWPLTLPFSKGNAVTSDNFLEHPLSFALGTDASGVLSASYIPTWNNQAFSYGRIFFCYKEIPACFLPLSAAYQFANTTGSLDTVTLSGGPATQFDEANSAASAKVAYDSSVISSAPTFSNLISTYGMTPQAISSYATTGTILQERQMYSMDPDAIVLEFDGTNLNVLSAPVGGTTLPAAITTGTFDGLTRVIVDLTTLPTTGNYVNGGYCRWYLHCTTPQAMAAGVVVKDTGSGSGAAANLSFATDGMLYLWAKNSSSKMAIQAATSYGVVGLADSSGYSSGTTASAALNWAYPFAVSAYTKSKTWVSDSFDRSGTLPGSSGTGFNSIDSGVVGWGSTSGGGTLICATTGGGQLTASSAGSWCEIPLGTGIYGAYQGSTYGGGMMGFYITPTAYTGNNLHLILTNTGSYVDGTSDMLDMYITKSGSSFTANFQSIVGGSATSDTTNSSSFSYSAGQPVAFIYVPATNEVFITVNGILELKKKLTTLPSWIPSYAVLKMDTNITATNFSITGNPLGTFLTTPQNTESGAGSATIYGGVATGEGISASLSPLGTTGTLNFYYKSAVGTALENYCDRVIVHYPYFH